MHAYRPPTREDHSEHISLHTFYQSDSKQDPGACTEWRIGMCPARLQVHGMEHWNGTVATQHERHSHRVMKRLTTRAKPMAGPG